MIAVVVIGQIGWLAEGEGYAAYAVRLISAYEHLFSAHLSGQARLNDDQVACLYQARNRARHHLDERTFAANDAAGRGFSLAEACQETWRLLGVLEGNSERAASA